MCFEQLGPEGRNYTVHICICTRCVYIPIINRAQRKPIMLWQTKKQPFHYVPRYQTSHHPSLKIYIPLSINKPLSETSSNNGSQMHHNQEAPNRSGYMYKKCSNHIGTVRNMTWFNPPHSRNSKQPQWWRQQEHQNLHISVNTPFVSLYILQLLSIFVWHKMTCFAVVFIMWALGNKC